MTENGARRSTGLARRAWGDFAIGLVTGALWWIVYRPLGLSPLGAGLLAVNAVGAVLAGLALDAALLLTRGKPAAAGLPRIAFLFGALGLAPAVAIALDRLLPGANPVSATFVGAISLAAIVAASSAAMGLVARAARLALARPALRWLATAGAGILLLAVTAAATPRDFSRRVTALPRPPIRVERAPTGAFGRLTVVGVDGADWRILLPLIRAGRLPGFARFFEEPEATALVCESLLDADGEISSPVVWTSLATGFSPAGHGIDGWASAISVNRRVPALWNVVAGAEQGGLILNVPGTYPPDPIPGLMIAGMPLPEPVLSQVPGFFFSAAPERSPFARFQPLPLAPHADGGATLRLPIPRIPDPARASALGVSHLFVRHLIVEGLARPSLSWLFAAEESAEFHLRIEGSRVTASTSVRPGEPPSIASWERSDFSPPLRFGSSGLVGRVKVTGDSATPEEVFVSPLLRSISDGGYASDRALTMALEERFGPLVADTPPWMPVVGDPDLIELWAAQTIDSTERRAETALHLFESDEHADAALRFVVFTETDRAQHALWSYREPNAFDPAPPADDVLRFGGVIDELYEVVDRFLVRLLETRSPGDVIAVVSDHGFTAGHAAECVGDHRLEGVFLAIGPGVARRDASGLPADESALETISVLDVTPSLLHLMGLPSPEGADGRVRDEVVEGGADGARRFEIPKGYDRRDASGGSAPMTLGAEAAAQVRALGYTGGPSREKR